MVADSEQDNHLVAEESMSCSETVLLSGKHAIRWVCTAQYMVCG